MTTEPKLATTWEECAQHVEAGGVVEWLHPDDTWGDECATAAEYRALSDAPGKDYYPPRRLLPIKGTTPAGMTPGPEVDGRPTWYGTARDAEVAGMTETRRWTDGEWSYVGTWDAASIIQARYPLPPKPRTVRVHWSEAVGREDPHDGVICVVRRAASERPQVYFAGGGCKDVTSPDGTVEVLVEDGES